MFPPDLAAILAYKQRSPPIVLDTEEQLARLRQRIATVERRFSEPRLPAPPPPVRVNIEECVSGQVITSAYGQHFESERFFPGHRPHGSADVGALCELPPDLLDALGSGLLPACKPEHWAFLDTETTGLAGGSGTYAFLIGVGRITNEGFSVRQFFMRDYSEERSTLTALRQHLSEFDVLITYNGRSYDQPLLETRFRMMRESPPFHRLAHLDLLYGARRLWKLRLEGCKLTALEEQILGYQREGDVPGHLIPHLYFDFLRGGQASRLLPVLQHNALDILTLACLTAIVPAAFRTLDGDALSRAGVRHGPDLAGIARWLLAEAEWESALVLFKRAVDAGLPDSLLFRCLWDIASLEKKLGNAYAAVQLWTELAGCRNDYRVAAFEALAKYYEHKEKNYALALDFTCEALRYSRSAALEARKCRLEVRVQKRVNRRLPLY